MVHFFLKIVTEFFCCPVGDVFGRRLACLAVLFCLPGVYSDFFGMKRVDFSLKNIFCWCLLFFVFFWRLYHFCEHNQCCNFCYLFSCFTFVRGLLLFVSVLRPIFFAFLALGTYYYIILTLCILSALFLFFWRVSGV